MPDADGVYQQADIRKIFPEGVTWRDWLWVRELLATCIRKAEPGQILDVGCGLGFFVELCRLWNIPCEGIEGSEYAVSSAKERGVHIHQHNLANERPFPFADSSFTVAMMSEVIEHLPHSAAQSTLRECWRCLMPGGTLIILTPSRFNTQEAREPAHINLYVPTEMKTEIERAGFIFREYLDSNWPRPVFSNWRIERRLWQQICKLYRPDWLSMGASVIAQKPQQ